MKIKKILLAGLIFIIMTACSSNPDDWEDGVLDIDYGQQATSDLFYKIDIDGPVKKTYERKSGDGNIREKVKAGIYIIYVTAYSDSSYITVYAEGSDQKEVNAGAFTYVTIIPTNSTKAITAFSFPTTPVSIGIIDEGSKTITVSVPFGTDVTTLTPSVTYIGDSYLPPGQVDFTNPVNYIVIASDDSMKYYKVTVTVREPAAQWARSVAAGTSASGFNAVAVDSSGNVYAAGYQRGNGLFNYGNGITATGAHSAYNVVLVKYDSNGAAQWARSVEAGTNSSYFNAVAVDSSGNVYAAGHQIGNGQFNYGNSVTVVGAYNGSGSSDGNVVLVKYNSNGMAQWARSVEAGTNSSYFNAVAVDSSGNVYAAGYQNGNGTFTYGSGVSVPGYYSGDNVVLVKYNSSGAAQWARSTEAGTSNSRFNAIAVDSSGNVYAAGYQNGNGQFNYGGTANAQGVHTSSNVVLVKYNSDGDAQWARSSTTDVELPPGAISVYSSQFNAVAVDSLGNVYAAGYQQGNGLHNYGNSVTVVGADSGNNVVLVKYDTNGNAQWARSTEAGTNSSQFGAVAVDSSGNVYVAGFQNGNGQFDYGNSITVTGAYNNPGLKGNSHNVVLVKYNSSGAAQWAQSTQIPADGQSEFGGIAVDSSYNIYAAGYQSGTGTITYGSGVSAQGYYSGDNVVLVKYRE